MLGRVALRPWALAVDAPQKPTGVRAAPFGLDFEEGCDEVLQSTIRDHFNGHADGVVRFRTVSPAGSTFKDGRKAEDCLTKSSWDTPDWKGLQSTYMQHAAKGPLTLQHKRFQKNRELTQEVREERWVNCLKQWQGNLQASKTEDQNTLSGKTDFSLLPAGWTVDSRKLPLSSRPQVKTLEELPHDVMVPRSPRYSPTNVSKEPLTARSPTPAMSSLPRPTPSKARSAREDSVKDSQAVGSIREPWMMKVIQDRWVRYADSSNGSVADASCIPNKQVSRHPESFRSPTPHRAPSRAAAHSTPFSRPPSSAR